MRNNVIRSHPLKGREASLESNLSRRLRYLPMSCAIEPGVTSCYLVLARWWRQYALDISCHKGCSAAWVCIKI